MSLPATLIMVFLVAVVTSLGVAARLTRVTVRGRKTEDTRHWSTSDIPRVGGVAVFLALPIGVLAAVSAKGLLVGGSPELPERASGLVLSAVILFAVGLLDDIRRVSPIAKLVAQTGAALIICGFGFTIQH